MTVLPDEIWIQILDYLEPIHLLPIQQVSRRLLKLARDSSLWRSKCFEKSPSAVNAFASPDSLADLLNGLSINTQEPKPLHAGPEQAPRMSKRARAIAKWDWTDPEERIDWYSEFIARQAPLTTEWQHHTEGNEIRSMALFDGSERILSAMEDGSLRIWDIRTATNGRRSFREAGRSDPGLLFTDFVNTSGPSSSPKEHTTGTAVDSTVVDPSGTKAYIAVGEQVHEVDLAVMSVVSQNSYAWNVTAISQQAGDNYPLMVGTSFSLHMHDSRRPLRHQAHRTDATLDIAKEDENTVFLPNYNKRWTPTRVDTSYHEHRSSSYRRHLLDAWAPVEPGPQTIFHRGENEIIVAGRMPSILFYDKRCFPKLQSVIHSGARLSSLTVLPHPPRDSTSADATLIAAGEYHGRGSLEIYQLPHSRPSDRQPSYEVPENYISASGSASGSSSASQENINQPTETAQPSQTPESSVPYSFKNRQSSSAAKILSVVTQGARILYSDSEGKLHWLERSGRGLARRWNINSYKYTRAGGAVIGESVARKLVLFPSDAADGTGNTRGDGDVLFWTGSDLGIVSSKTRWTGHDELVQAFEEQMILEESGEGAARRRTSDREEEYARVMRRALERQADERRFLARFGRVR